MIPSLPPPMKTGDPDEERRDRIIWRAIVLITAVFYLFLFGLAFWVMFGL